MNATFDTLRSAHGNADVLRALAGADGLFVVVDPIGRITAAGGAAITLLTGGDVALEGRSVVAALREAPALEGALREALDGTAGHVRETVADTVLDVRAAPLQDEHGAIVGAVAFAVEASADQPRVEPVVAVELGGTSERATIEAALESAIRAARRGTTSALLHARVGDLRLVNRALGRAGGDALLADSWATLRELFPQPTVIYRIGPADFAVLLEHLQGSGVAAAAEATEKAVARLEGTVSIGETGIRRTARAAAVLIRAGDETPEDLLQIVEDEVRAQASGQSAVARPDSRMRTDAREDLGMLARLEGAGDRNELRLFYQPIYGLEREALYGVEGLLRWTDAELGVVPPARFIPVAEESGAIHELGGWVIDELCRHASGWDDDRRPVQLHFNASAVELQRPGYARDLLRRAARHGIAPSRLVLEVTESAALLDHRRTFDVLAQLRFAGMQVAIDDFGAGHSSLTRLKDLPADILKIDRGIVSDIAVSREARAIVTAAVTLAGDLGMVTVAEGIETAEQRHALMQAGCALGQGFMLGHPAELIPRR